MATNKFWIVVSDQRGPASWPCRHTSEESAFREAERLAFENPGKFFVMEAIGASIRNLVRTSRFDHDNEIPF